VETSTNTVAVNGIEDQQTATSHTTMDASVPSVATIGSSATSSGGIIDLPTIIQAASGLSLPDAAMHYARNGVGVFPCNDSKAPLIKDDGGFHSATTDIGQIADWWGKSPSALIGMPTGSGIVVVDIDRKKGDGIVSARKLNLTDTFTVRTRSSGGHLYYRGDSNCTTNLVPNVDIRSNGGYVIVPPSPGYSVLEPMPIEPLPETVKALLGKPHDRAKPKADTTKQRSRLGSLVAETELPKIKAALAKVDPSCDYDTWIKKVGMAIHSAFPDDTGFELWHEWSASGDNYNGEDDCRKHWDSFTVKEGGVTIATLYGIANEEGEDGDLWEDVDEEEETETPPPTEPPSQSLILKASDWLAEPEPVIVPIIKGIVNKGGKLQIVAPPKCRKSFFTLQLAVGLSTGTNQCGFEITTPRNTLLIQYEISKAEYWHRLDRMCRAVGVEKIRTDRLSIVNARGLGITLDDIPTLVQESQAEVVILDPKYKAFLGIENDARDNSLFGAKLDSICESSGATLIYVHHDAKGIAGDRQDTDRGSGSGVGSVARRRHPLPSSWDIVQSERSNGMFPTRRRSTRRRWIGTRPD